jgi:hypothetical protein
MTLTNMIKTRLSRKYLFAGIIIFFILFNLSFYLNERRHWINNSHAHLQAKEYFVLGKVVFFYRKMLNIVVNTENPVMRPLNNLQELLYNKGVALIPEKDAERAVWKYHFFYYFYGKGFHLPDDDMPRKVEVISPKKVKLLDEIFATIEIMAIQPIVDSEINKMRHKSLPLLIMLYQQNQGNYYGNYPDPSRMDKLLKDKNRFSRIPWLIDVLNKNMMYLESNEDTRNEISTSDYQVLVYHYMSILSMTGDVIRSKFESNKFKCSDAYNSIYIDNRTKLIHLLNSNKMRMPNSQRELIYSMALQSGNDPVYSYVLAKYCSFEKDEAYPNEEYLTKLQKSEKFIELEKKLKILLPN